MRNDELSSSNELEIVGNIYEIKQERLYRGVRTIRDFSYSLII